MKHVLALSLGSKSVCLGELRGAEKGLKTALLSFLLSVSPQVLIGGSATTTDPAAPCAIEKPPGWSRVSGLLVSNAYLLLAFIYQILEMGN